MCVDLLFLENVPDYRALQPGASSPPLSLSSGEHMLRCQTVLQVGLSSEAKAAWQLEQLHR